MSRFLSFSARRSSSRVKKPPMFARASFLPLMVAPSVYENISWAISRRLFLEYPGSRFLIKNEFSA
jgi:hypothetical protein